jgi:hypothetical protein
MSDFQSRGGLAEQELLNKVPTVAPPSGAHNILNIVDLAAQVTSHGYGFSFYDPTKMASDTKRINEFIKEARTVQPGEIIKIGEKHNIRIYSTSTMWNTMANPFGRETYKGESQEGRGEGYYIVFAVKFPDDKFICYSTHEIGINTQLYPVCGNVAGLVQGRGPIDMAVILKSRNQLTREKKIALCLVYRQLWQKLEPKDLPNLDPEPPTPQKNLEITIPNSNPISSEKGESVQSSTKSKVTVPKGGWSTNKRGTKSAAQTSKVDGDQYVAQMDLLVDERERNPRFNPYAFLGLD